MAFRTTINIIEIFTQSAIVIVLFFPFVESIINRASVKIGLVAAGFIIDVVFRHRCYYFSLALFVQHIFTQ